MQPSFDSHRNTDAIEALAKTIQPLQEELAKYSLGAPERLEIWMKITQAYLQMSHYDDAIKASAEFEAELNSSGQPDVSLIIRQLHGLATAFREKQQFSSAEKLYLKAHRLLEKLNLDNEAHRKAQIDFFRDFGIFYLCQKKYAQATELLSHGVKASAEIPELAKAHLALRNYFALSSGLARNFEVALPLLEKIRAEWTQVPSRERETSMDYGSHLYHTARVREKLAKQLFVGGKQEESRKQSQLAMDDLRESIRIREKLVNTTIGQIYTNSRIADPAWLLGKLLISIGQKTEGQECLARSKACYTQMGTVPAGEKAARIESKWLNPQATRSSIFTALTTQSRDIQEVGITETTPTARH